MKIKGRTGLRAVAGATLLISACANLNTIERRTTLPGDNGEKAIAVHLDAKQRLVISHSSGIYCAEPNPDALSAASSGQSASASAAGKGSGALSLASQESAASIGLRTQSIQLQREVFYRLCEAYYNGGISQVQLGTLLSRSQDLTAVVLAVEQLTGAVTANQVILTGSAGSTSLASLVSNQKALEMARASEAGAKDRLDKANKAKEAQDAVVAGAKQDLDTAENALKTEKGKTPLNPAEVDRLTADRAEKSRVHEAAVSKAEAFGGEAEQAQLNYNDAKGMRETVEASADSAMAGAAANATGSGSFVVPSSRNALSAEATAAIAGAVQKMVVKALDQDGTIPTCLGVLAWASEEERAIAEIRALAADSDSDKDTQTKLNAAAESLNENSRKDSRANAREVCLQIIVEHIQKKKDESSNNDDSNQATPPGGG
jgi:hypothetical protein